MKNNILVIASLLFSLYGFTQTKSSPLLFSGIEIYALNAPVQSYDVVATRDISKESSKYATRSFSDRVDMIVNFNSSKPYNAIITRDGITIQYIRTKNMRNEPEGVLVNMSGTGVDMYFLSQPMQRYQIVGQKRIDQFNFTQSFISLSNDLLAVKFKLEYNAVIVGVDMVSYVVY